MLAPVPSPSNVRAPQKCSTVMNPLVMAGFVPVDLSYIQFIPLQDSAVTMKRTKHITGARKLTSDDIC